MKVNKNVGKTFEHRPEMEVKSRAKKCPGGCFAEKCKLRTLFCCIMAVVSVPATTI